MPRGSRHGDDQGIVADARISCSPWRQIGKRVGPANSDDAGFGCLPTVTAAAHPVICVRKGNAADSMLARESDRSFHAVPSVQVAGTAVAIPSFQCAKTCDEPRLGVDDNYAAFGHSHELGKAVQAMRIDAVARGFSEELCAKAGAAFLETQIDEDFQENGEEFIVRDAHGIALHNAGIAYSRSSTHASWSRSKQNFKRFQRMKRRKYFACEFSLL